MVSHALSKISESSRVLGVMIHVSKLGLSVVKSLYVIRSKDAC